MGAGERYDEIGRTYARTRCEDPRIAVVVHGCLGEARTVVNVGAGTGNYEPADRDVVAVEPSVRMLAQRPSAAAPAIRGTAERLPFADGTFDAALAILTVHHWADRDAGIRELARVARRQVIWFFEPLATHDFWALEYWPSARDLPTETDAPGIALLERHLDVVDVRPLLVPRDCQDGFGTAFWARPEAYLEPEVQAGMSWLAMLTEDERASGSAKLRAELRSGAWDRRYGHLRDQATFDGGYRIAIAG